MSINTLVYNPVVLEELKVALNSAGGSVLPITIQPIGPLIVSSNTSYQNGFGISVTLDLHVYYTKKAAELGLVEA